MRISFIGFGNMAKALALSLLQDPHHHIQASSPSLPIDINADGIHTHHQNAAIVPTADVIILAVKPAQMDAVLQEIGSLFTPQQLIVSIAAGLTLDWFEKRIAAQIPIVRAIPNLAASCAQSATPLFANDYVTPQHRVMAEHIFLSAGLLAWAEREEDLDAFTALSGSGPAYLFLFMESMMNAAIKLGLSEPIARSFAIQTVQGAANLAMRSELSLHALQHAVASKGGTTAAALQVFHEKHLNDIVSAAMTAAYKRSQELAQN